MAEDSANSGGDDANQRGERRRLRHDEWVEHRIWSPDAAAQGIVVPPHALPAQLEKDQALMKKLRENNVSFFCTCGNRPLPLTYWEGPTGEGRKILFVARSKTALSHDRAKLCRFSSNAFRAGAGTIKAVVRGDCVVLPALEVLTRGVLNLRRERKEHYASYESKPAKRRPTASLVAILEAITGDCVEANTTARTQTVDALVTAAKLKIRGRYADQPRETERLYDHLISPLLSRRCVAELRKLAQSSVSKLIYFVVDRAGDLARAADGGWHYRVHDGVLHFPAELVEKLIKKHHHPKTYTDAGGMVAVLAHSRHAPDEGGGCEVRSAAWIPTWGSCALESVPEILLARWLARNGYSEVRKRLRVDGANRKRNDFVIETAEGPIEIELFGCLRPEYQKKIPSRLGTFCESTLAVQVMPDDELKVWFPARGKWKENLPVPPPRGSATPRFLPATLKALRS